MCESKSLINHAGPRGYRSDGVCKDTTNLCFTFQRSKLSTLRPRGGAASSVRHCAVLLYCTSSSSRRRIVQAALAYREPRLDQHRTATAALSSVRVRVLHRATELTAATARMDQELYDAARDGNVGEVLRTLLSGAKSSSKFGDVEKTALHVACSNGHLDAVRALLLVKADVDSRNKEERTPLDYACCGGHFEIVQTLLQIGANVEARDNHRQTPLMKACWYGQVKTVQLLLEKGADIRAESSTTGATALHAACSYLAPNKNQYESVVEIVKMLLAKGADLGAQDKGGYTPLHLACAGEEDRSKLVEILLEKGAGVHAKNNNEDTPLHRACYFANSTIVKMLLEHGAQLEAKCNHGSTPLYDAACSRCDSDEDIKQVVQLLFDNGATVMNAKYNDGSTALHAVCVRGNLGTAKLLLDRGAALEAKDENNQTPLHHACYSNHLEMVKELVQRGADIFAKSEDDATPFDEALKNDADEVAEYLLEQYKEEVKEREGRLSLHAVLREATNLENNKVRVSIGTITVDQLLTLLVAIHSQDTDAIRCQDDNRALPLHIACHGNAPIQVFHFLVGQDETMLYMMDSAGSLPIHAACRGGALLDKIKFLIEKGGIGTLCARDNQCALPLHILCQSQPTVDVVKYMLKTYPISVSEQTSAGALPLMLACESSASESVLQELLTAHPKALDKMKTYYSL